MSDSEKRIQCAEHSETVATFVCRHVREGVGCGFHVSACDADDRWPDAWCDLCEQAFQREGEWNDTNEPKISVLCTGCYETARARNSYVPEPFCDYSELARGAYQRCLARQEAAKQLWPRFSTGRSWYYDDHNATLTFADGSDEHVDVADVTILGSFSARTNTWMWAWDNEEYSPSARQAVAPLRVFGEVRGIAKFETGHWEGDEIDAWEVAQLAADLLGAAAVYRAPFDHLMVFMLLNSFRSELADARSD